MEIWEETLGDIRREIWRYGKWCREICEGKHRYGKEHLEMWEVTHYRDFEQFICEQVCLSFNILLVIFVMILAPYD